MLVILSNILIKRIYNIFFVFSDSFCLDMNLSGSGSNFNNLSSEQDGLMSG